MATTPAIAPAFANLTSVRHPLVQRIVKAYEVYNTQSLQQQSLTFDAPAIGENR